MTYAGAESKLGLRGPSGQILRLAPTGKTLQIAWETLERRQCEVEIRARMVEAQGTGDPPPLGLIPIVRMRAELGHGKVVWRDPSDPFAIIAGAAFQHYSLPARGAVWRLNVREFRLAFTLLPPLSGADFASVSVQVSVQPCLGMPLPLFPYADLAFPVGPTIQHAFPMEAREWRLADATGLPLAPAAVGITFAGINGALFGPIDGASVADYRPIPHEAAGWLPTFPTWAYYR